MEIARWLIVFVAFITGTGGLFADYVIPASAAQHMKNPRWPPHAKFHNAQGILLGVALGIVSIALLFLHRPLHHNLNPKLWRMHRLRLQLLLPLTTGDRYK